MSLYKNIGPITYLFDTQKTQIFQTTQWYLIQIKNSTNITDKTTLNILQTIVIKYNQKLGNKQYIKIYHENFKPPSLILSKQYIKFFYSKSNCNISQLSMICKGIINSIELFQSGNNLGKIQKQMLFICLDHQQIFYIHIPQEYNKIGNKSNQIKILQHQNIQIILQFLYNHFNTFNHISYQLLFTKLQKCTIFKQVKEQLQYFQTIYQTGIQKKIKNKEYFTNRQHENQIKKNHRIYHKKIQQNNTKSASKRLSSSSNLSNRQSYKNNQQKQTSIKQNKYQLLINKNSNLSTRNKSSNAIHYNSNSSTQRYQKYSLHKSKSLFSNSKPKINNIKIQFNNYISKNSIISNHLNKTNNIQNYINKQRKSINIDKYSSRQLNIKDKYSSSQFNIKDQILMKDIINKNLNQWKDKRNKLKNKKIAVVKEISSNQKQDGKIKSIKRKNKNNIGEGKSGNCFGKESASQWKNGEEIGELESENGQNVKKQKISKNQNVGKSCDKIQKVQLISECVQKKAQLKEKNQKQTEKFATRELKTQAARELEAKKQSTTNKIYEQTQIQEINFTCINNEQTRRQNQQQLNQKQKDAQKLTAIKDLKQPKDDKVNKQKTKRKLNITSPQQNLFQNYLKSTKCQFQKINYIGQCVTKMPNYILQIQQKTGDKYLWQLPAFLLYKQFYHKRLQLLQMFKQNIYHLLTQQHNKNINDATIFIQQIEKQNNQIKQSLQKLLKLVNKKIKKYNMTQPVNQLIKTNLNINPNNRNTSLKKLDQICYNFMKQLQQIRQKYPQIIKFYIQFIDAQIIIKGGQIDINQKNNIQLEKYYSNNTNNYFNKRIKILCSN